MGCKQLQKYETNYHQYIKLIGYTYLTFFIIWQHIFKFYFHLKFGHELIVYYIISWTSFLATGAKLDVNTYIMN
jgi:hypothetical protein